MYLKHLIDRARLIGYELLDHARQLEDSSITWGRGFGTELQPVDDAGIFNGRSGEALFLAALYAATKEQEFERGSLQALHAICSGVGSESYCRDLQMQVGIGIAGVGSIIYALIRAGDFLGRDELIHDAKRLAATLTPAVIERDETYDVFWGSAGTLLALLALADRDTEDALILARRCAEHLIAKRVAEPQSGLRAWPSASGMPHAGFAHGSTGIAHALLQTYERIRDNRYYDAALEAFAFERALYRTDSQDWPDYRDQPGERVMASWCHGAGGIALSRLCALSSIRTVDVPDVSQDLTRALNTIQSCANGWGQSLCCGRAGRVDVLLEAGLRLADDSLVDAARLQAQFLVQTMAVQRLKDEAPRGRGLWQGIVGVGYEFLRLARPAVYPSILLFA